MDYYSKRLATCSSDRTVKIFHVDDPRNAVATLTAHSGPVWEVAWSHPKYGSLLASCSYDKKVIIYKEDTSSGSWAQIHVASNHTSSVNSIAWAPHQYGLWLACASSDGTVSVLSYRSADNTWSVKMIPVGSMSCNSVSWAPFGHIGSNGTIARLVTGGCDNLVKIWKLDVTSGDDWGEDKEGSIACHNDWVRDVSWAPNTGMMCNTVASCSEDGKVCLHTQDSATGKWRNKTLNEFKVPVWRVSWSVTGHLLAVSAGDNDVTVWKEDIDGTWNQVSGADSNGFK